MRLFYDHLVDRSKFVSLIEREARDEEEKKKLHQTLDEIIHHTVLDVILIHLDEKHHEEFLALIHKTPHSKKIIIYIKQKGHKDIEEKIRSKIESLAKEIEAELKP